MAGLGVAGLRLTGELRSELRAAGWQEIASL
jgi:hypothetical protein